jgi:hypothetical protein
MIGILPFPVCHGCGHSDCDRAPAEKAAAIDRFATAAAAAAAEDIA